MRLSSGISCEPLETRCLLAATLVQVSAFDTPGSAVATARSGDVLAIADSSRGLSLYSVANPSSPVFLSTLQTQTPCLSVKIVNNLAYLGLTSSLQIVDITNPRAIRTIGAIPTNAATTDLAISGASAYLATGSNGLSIINVSNPSQPTLISRLAGVVVNQVALRGTTAYLAQGPRGCLVVDTSDLSHPTIQTTLLPGYNVVDVAVSGQALFVGTAGNGLSSYSISNPLSPALQSTIQMPNSELISSLSTSGAELWIGTSNTVSVYNASNLTNVVFDGSYSVAGNTVADVSFSTGLAFVGVGQAGIRILEARGTAGFVTGGVLTVNGTSAADIVSVSLESSNVIAVTLNGIVARYAASTINALSISTFTGADLITVSNGLPPATIRGGQGFDTILAGDSSDLIYGGKGNDSINAGPGNDTVYGGEGNDTLGGGKGADVIYGEDGNDSINGGRGFDQIDGGAGNDVLNGNEGNDTLFGGTGYDTLIGGPGNDVVYTNGVLTSIVDMIDGEVDTVHANSGIDVLHLDSFDVLLPL